MTEHRGGCHCGRIALVLRETPVDAVDCNCSLCRRTAGLWHHCGPEAVRVDGEGIAYVQGDRTLATWHCPACGCVTHRTPLDPAGRRMAVNLRMFDPALWRDLPRRAVDGASF